jgi:hypothetical protein
MHQEQFAFVDERSIEERFDAFKREHPDVLEMFERFARELRSSGQKRGSSKLIFERLRWEHLTCAHGAEAPALNNDYTSRLARWLIERDRSFDGWFETRQLKSQ